MADLDPAGALPVSFASTLRPGTPFSGSDTIDADYIVLPIGDAFPREFRQAKPPRPVDGMALLRGRATRSAFVARRGGPMFWLLGLCLAAMSFWVSGGHALVLERLAANDSGAAARVASVSWRIDRTGSHPVLLVDGAAVRDGKGGLPSFDAVVAADDGGVTRYRLGTSADVNAPATSFVFSGRFRAPTTSVRTVSVTVAD